MILGEISPYPYTYVTSKINQKPKLRTRIYRFKDKSRLDYLVEVEEYEYKLFAIKFYVKKQSGNSGRFCFMTKKGFARPIIHTCIKIGIDIWKENELASFCFIGAPTRKEYEEKGYKNTKRFRSYGRASRFFLSPEVFDHVDDEKHSAYFLINKKAKESHPTLLSSILQMFNDNYVMESLFPDVSSVHNRNIGGSTLRRDKRQNR